MDGDDDSEPKIRVYHFDETNFNGNHTLKRNSEFLAFGHSKKHLNHKPQVGLAVLVDGKTKLHVLCSIYKGSIHDSKVFTSMRKSIFEFIKKQNNDKSYVSVDKGNLSKEMYADFDAEENTYYISTNSFMQNRELATIPLSSYMLLSIDKNQRLLAAGRPEDRAMGVLLSNIKDGDNVTYLLAFNKQTAERKEMTLQKHLDKMTEKLKDMKSEYNKSDSCTNDIALLNSKFEKFCKEHNYESSCFSITTYKRNDGTFGMRYRRNNGVIEGLRKYFGKHLISSDDISQVAEEIYMRSNDNWKVESFFKLLNDPNFIGTLPLQVWDDRHIVLHIAVCVIAGSVARYFELKLQKAGIKLTAKRAFSIMESLHCREVTLRSGKVIVVVDEPNKEQEKIIDLLGHYYSNGNILKIGRSEYKNLGYSPGPGRPPGSRNKSKVA